MSDYHDRRLKREMRNPIFAFHYWRARRQIRRDQPAYDRGYLAGLRMAAAAVPGDVNQPALQAIDAVIDSAKAQQADRILRAPTHGSRWGL